MVEVADADVPGMYVGLAEVRPNAVTFSTFDAVELPPSELVTVALNAPAVTEPVFGFVAVTETLNDVAVTAVIEPTVSGVPSVALEKVTPKAPEPIALLKPEPETVRVTVWPCTMVAGLIEVIVGAELT